MKQELERYAELKSLIKKANEEIDEIKLVVIEKMEVDTNYEVEGATISLSKGRPSWKYSEMVTIQDKELKKAKKEEEKLGVAEQVFGAPFILCNLNKVE